MYCEVWKWKFVRLLDSCYNFCFFDISDRLNYIKEIESKRF